MLSAVSIIWALQPECRIFLSSGLLASPSRHLALLTTVNDLVYYILGDAGFTSSTI